jgi:hypothetical protein
VNLAVVTAPHRWRLVRAASRLAAVLVLVATMLAAPVGGPPGSPWPPAARAAATCSGWASDSVPPATIRVRRTAGPASGSVQVVSFHDYVTVVMAAEWGPGNPAEVLKAGAVAVKEYAWYYAMFWRGGTAADGSCYDVVDSTMDQVYAPETRVPAASLTAAVDATWGISVRKSGGLFVTHYQAGSNVACGANADGGHLYQISATHCAQSGMTAGAILDTYYGPGLEIVGALPGSTATAVALRFLAQPSGGTADVTFPIQPVVAVVDAAGQTVTTDVPGGTIVSLTLDSPTPGASLTCAGGLSRTAVAGVTTFDGCLLSGGAPGAVLVAAAAGLTPASTLPFAVAPTAPSLTLAPFGTALTWGQDLQFAANLAPAGPEDPSGRTLHLQRSTDGIGWAPVADLTTDADGAAGIVDRPTTNVFYRLVFDGAPDLAPAASPVVPVLVRSQAQLRPDSRGTARRVSRGTSVTFSTLVRPVAGSSTPGRVEYRLFLLVGSSWVQKRSWTVGADATGAARLRVTFGSRGSWSVRAMALPTPTNAGSAWTAAQRYNVP